MKTLKLSVVSLVGTIALHAQTPSRKSPVYEELFNLKHERLEFRYGAGLGAPGTGVSGKVGDRAYVGRPRSSEQDRDSSVALALSPMAPDPLSTFTFTFWYYMDETGPDLQMPLSTAGVGFLWHYQTGWEVRVSEAAKTIPFAPGPGGPIVDWTDRSRWIFAVFTWEQATNSMTIYQGTPDRAVEFMRQMTRPTPVGPTFPRTNLQRLPEAIGNTYQNQDRPLAGRMDDLRIFDRVLSLEELEKIRQADVQGTPLPSD